MNLPYLKKGERPLITPQIIAGNAWKLTSIRNPYLKEHSRKLWRLFCRDNRWSRQLRDSSSTIFEAVESKTNLFTQVSANQLNLTPILVRMAHYHSHWIRHPSTWHPSKTGSDPFDIIRSLARHLFCQYELPRGFDLAWKWDGPLSHIERDIYCHLGSGGSLRTAPNLTRHLTKRAAHLTMNAPEKYRIREAIRYGQVAALSGDQHLVNQVLNSSIGLNFQGDAVWLPLLESLISQDRSFDELELILDYIDVQRQHHQSFSFEVKRRPWSELLATAKRTFEQIKQAALKNRYLDESDEDRMVATDKRLRRRLILIHRLSWERWEEIPRFNITTGNEKTGWAWEIQELTSQRALLDEGDDMCHCIAAYGDDCRSGKAAIFSLRSRRRSDEKMERDVTIHVDPRTGTIIEMRAWLNHFPHPQSARIIKRWAKANALIW